MTRYCAGHESDPEKVQRVIKGLKVLARLGRRAERALAAMERGESFGPVAWLGRPDDRLSWHSGNRRFLGSGLEGLCLNTAHSLAPCHQISREDIPGWADLSIQFGELDEEIISKNTVRFFQLKLSGMGLHFRDGQISSFRLTGAGCVFGDVRLKSDGSLSMLPQYHMWAIPDEARRVIRIPAGGLKADEAARRIADVVAAALIRGPYSSREEECYPQELMDLRKEVPGWLLEDGTVRRWIDQIREHAASVRAVADVMEE